MHHDWYAATLRTDPLELAQLIGTELVGQLEAGRGLYGYSDSVVITRSGETVARVLYGGRNSGVNVQSSGNDARDVAALLRTNYRALHAVTRADAAEDFDAPGTWDRMCPALLAIADARNLVIDQRGDWHRGGISGRTLYLGATSSAVRLRLYEKGKEQLSKGLVTEDEYRPDWVRIEVQVRPEGDSRFYAAVCAPELLYGFADWSQEVASLLLGVEAPRVHIKPVRDSDVHRSIRAMTRQYARVVVRRGEELGSIDLAMAELQRLFVREYEARETA